MQSRKFFFIYEKKPNILLPHIQTKKKEKTSYLCVYKVKKFSCAKAHAIILHNAIA